MAGPKTSPLLWSHATSVLAASFFFVPASSHSKLRLNSKSFSSAAPWAGETSSSSVKLASRVLNLPPCPAGLASQHPSTNWNSIATTIFLATNSASKNPLRANLFPAYHAALLCIASKISTGIPLAYGRYHRLNFVHTVTAGDSNLWRLSYLQQTG